MEVVFQLGTLGKADTSITSSPHRQYCLAVYDILSKIVQKIKIL